MDAREPPHLSPTCGGAGTSCTLTFRPTFASGCHG